MDFDPVYPCRVCKVNKPMRYVPWASSNPMPEGLDLVQCVSCETTQVRDVQDRLKMARTIAAAFTSVDNPVDDTP